MSVENVGGVESGVGPTVTKSTNPGGTIVMLNEYAWAIEGMEHVALDWMGKVRLAPPTRLGGPKAPVNPDPVRVSTTRQGVIPTKTSELAGRVSSAISRLIVLD